MTLELKRFLFFCFFFRVSNVKEAPNQNEKKNNSKKMGGEEPKIKDEITKKKRRGRRRPFWTSRRAESKKKTEKNGKKTKIEWNQSAARVFFAFFWNWKVSRSSIFAAPFWVDDTSNWNFCLKKKKETNKKNLKKNGKIGPEIWRSKKIRWMKMEIFFLRSEKE